MNPFDMLATILAIAAVPLTATIACRLFAQIFFTAALHKKHNLPCDDRYGYGLLVEGFAWTVAMGCIVAYFDVPHVQRIGAALGLIAAAKLYTLLYRQKRGVLEHEIDFGMSLLDNVKKP